MELCMTEIVYINAWGLRKIDRLLKKQC
jgi:hypothetical protein